MNAAWKKLRFFLSVRSDFHMLDSLSIAVHAFVSLDTEAPAHERASVERPARTNQQQFCWDRGCILEDLSEGMDDRDGWLERIREICARSRIGL